MSILDQSKKSSFTERAKTQSDPVEIGNGDFNYKGGGRGRLKLGGQYIDSVLG